MLPLTDVTIKAFRGIRDLELNGLGRINLLVGENNCGKTSVLEALVLLAASNYPLPLLHLPAAREGLAQRASRDLDGILLLFPIDTVLNESSERSACRTILVMGQGPAGPRSVGVAAKELLRARPPAADSAYEEIDRGLDWRVEISDGPGDAESRRQSGEIWTGAAVPVQPANGALCTIRLTRPENILDEVEAVRDWSVLSLEQQARSLELVRAFDPAVEALAINDPKGNRSRMVVEHAQHGRVLLEAFGDGTRRALHLALIAPGCNGGILLVDEIEAWLHYSALQTVFAWLVDACRRENVQLFATTHSLEAIDAIIEAVGDQHDDVVLYRLRRDGERTIGHRLSGEELHRFRYEHGWDVR